jgi:hypothetical protein
MLLSRQINKVKVQTQAQERLLIKVVEQNEATATILNRVEKHVIGIGQGMKKGFSRIQQDLSNLNNLEGLEEVKELWAKKMNDLEKAIQTGGAESTKLIQNQMKKLEVMLSAKLLDLDVNDDEIQNELGIIRQQLIEANNSRLKGEAQSEERLNNILSELKSLHTQLDRVEQMTIRIFQSMEIGLNDVRKELLENSNREGLDELRELWLKKVSELEKAIHSSTNQETFEKQMKKTEAMLNAKLLDLDLNISSLTPQLNDMKQQLHDVLVGMNQGVENSNERFGVMMLELKGLQTQLIEVVNLQKETAQNLSEVRNIATFSKFTIN